MDELDVNHTIKYRAMIKQIEDDKWLKQRLDDWKQIVREEQEIKKKKKELRQRILDFIVKETELYSSIRREIFKFADLDMEIFFEKFRDAIDILITRLTIRKLKTKKG